MHLEPKQGEPSIVRFVSTSGRFLKQAPHKYLAVQTCIHLINCPNTTAMYNKACMSLNYEVSLMHLTTVLPHIHLSIYEIYIAPLQGNYSELLPAQAKIIYR